jgi:hypothetical protein
MNIMNIDYICGMRTQDEINKRQKELRKLNGNGWTKKYERTKKGFLMRKYHHMRGRIDGHDYYPGAYMWAGKEILPKDEFYQWAINNNDFHELFDAWEKSGYERKLCPSVDRIDSSLGYIIGNMRFTTFQVNCIRGWQSRALKEGWIIKGKVL